MTCRRIKREAVVATVVAAVLTPAICLAGETNGLLAALRSAKPGTTIVLRAGYYRDNEIIGLHFTPPVTIASSDPTRPAVLQDLTLKNCSGINLRDLEFSTVGDPIGPRGAQNTIPFQVVKSRDIRFTRIKVHGDPAGTLATDETGMLVLGSSEVIVRDSEFSHLHTGFSQVDDDHLSFTGNYCHDLRDDCFHGSGTSWLTVTWNRSDSNHPDGAADTDHPDFIQLWGAVGEGVNQAHDILIAHNFYRRGRGYPTQGVFVQTMPKWHIPPLRNVRVDDNVILGGQYNGVYVQGVAPGTEVDHNLVRGHDDMFSRIVVRDSTGVDLHDNKAERFVIEPTTTSKISEKHDRLVGPINRDRDEEALSAQWMAQKQAAEAAVDTDDR